MNAFPNPSDSDTHKTTGTDTAPSKPEEDKQPVSSLRQGVEDDKPSGHKARKQILEKVGAAFLWLCILQLPRDTKESKIARLVENARKGGFLKEYNQFIHTFDNVNDEHKQNLFGNWVYLLVLLNLATDWRN